jgi:hypothetical protein
MADLSPKPLGPTHDDNLDQQRKDSHEKQNDVFFQSVSSHPNHPSSEGRECSNGKVGDNFYTSDQVRVPLPKVPALASSNLPPKQLTTILKPSIKLDEENDAIPNEI